MDCSPGILYPANALALKDISQSINNCFSLINDVLYKGITVINELNDVLVKLTVSIKAVSEENANYTSISSGRQENNRIEGGEMTIDSEADAPRKGEENSLIDKIEGLQKLAEGTKNIAGLFEGLSPGIKKFKSGLDIISNLTEGVSGIEALATAGDIGLMEGITIAGELAAGAEGVVALGSIFGPVGTMVALATVATASVAINAERADANKKREEEIHTKQAIQTFSMSEKEADKYIRSTEKLSTIKTHQWHTAYNPIKENTRRYGNNAYSLDNTFQPVYARADNVTYHANIPPSIHRFSEDKSVGKKSYLEQTSALQHKLIGIGLTSGREGFDNKVLEIAGKAKEYDRQQGTNTLAMKQSAIKEARAFMLHKANDGKTVVGFDPSSRSNRAQTPQQADDRHGGKVVNINLNKPLIGNFIINTRDVKEGVDNLKHKVEEVLLEILNSANAIK